MKLIFTSYVSSPEYDQPESWLKRISEYTGILESLSQENTVIGIERINYKGEYEQNGVQYYFTRLKKKVIRFPWRMHRMLKRLQPDVVFINGFIFPLQIIQLRLKLGRGVKIIVFHRSEKPFNGAKKYLQKLAEKCVNAFLFTSSEFGKQWVENGNIGDPGKIHEVMHGSSRFSPGDRAAARSAIAVTGSPVLLWVGRLNANKDPLTVVKAFIDFLSFQPLATLYMIYQTEELLDAIKDLIKQDGKAIPAVRLIGKIPHEQLQTWYNSADFIISGSHYEGGGIAVCEAMSCGCVPVVTNIISFRRMTGPGKCGFLYEPGNDKALLAVLLETRELDMETERARVLQQFKETLSFKAIAKKINQVIASL